MKLMRPALAFLLLTLVTGVPQVGAAEWSPDPREAGTLPTATRADLYKVLDAYLAALKVRDPSRVKWAARVRNTENNVALLVGDGLWGTITALGAYDLRFADTQTGQVGYYGTVTETEETAGFTVRLKVVNGLVAEAETLVVRQLDSGIKFEGQKFEHKPAMNEILPAAQRSPRARMVSIADGYFDTLQLNDGTLFTKFHPNCKRVENGVQTTQNANFAVVSVASLGCEEQFKMGNYRYDDRLRGRRFMLIDEERGLVLAAGFIDHSGKLDEYKLTNGKVVRAPLHRPHSFYLLELFKLKDGSIEQIEANFVTVPYNMPSPWDDWRD
ncbi:MAG: hypothetical protein ABI859_08580 [Pseudomonadota bacterium]